MDECCAMQGRRDATPLEIFANASNPAVTVKTLRAVPEQISTLIAALKRLAALRCDRGGDVAGSTI